MRDYHTVNLAVGRNGNVVNDSIDRIAQKFEAGNKCDVELAFGESLTQSGRMVELNIARPTANERTSVEILNATDADGFQRKSIFVGRFCELRKLSRADTDAYNSCAIIYAQASSAGAGVVRFSPVERGEICR